LRRRANVHWRRGFVDWNLGGAAIRAFGGGLFPAIDVGGDAALLLQPIPDKVDASGLWRIDSNDAMRTAPAELARREMCIRSP
jgi:hypothetical protein